MIYFETERLIARDWKESDIEQLLAMNADKEVMQYFLDTRTPEESLADYKIITEEIDQYGFGLFAFEEKHTGRFIGYLGLHHISFEMDFTPAVEIAWRFNKEFWNQGYATEGAIAYFKFAKSFCYLKEIYAFTAAPNKPSARVMQKSGMKYVKNFNHPAVPNNHPLLEHVLYVYNLKD